ncbi:hypothetical protein K493DRAFT_309921 [Basidiobolus meristosporus CBS 931.73]|uniref:Uncharacterized protein n=1 Tax=Basidiobolus meristosporus CBS 931.73 TaxID=1314790 RepID=A0A1Y1ZCV2_9FUNG|nr:hypothetical protein K493DRAFT_309921 [Basidiobolus meristosporus CBS 931.73]|eukprot:ORY08113.1 hypothetical protein K493DRAFT_309921 [Basidiobolus meristosporus CBS 931.73]
MGKSAKFFKRPNRKEKEVLKITKDSEPRRSKSDTPQKSGGVSKKVQKNATAGKIAKTIKQQKPFDDDIEMSQINELNKSTSQPAKKATAPKRDYVDILYGKKTFKPMKK